jgi:hypothetical protein
MRTLILVPPLTLFSKELAMRPEGLVTRRSALGVAGNRRSMDAQGCGVC